MQAEKPAEKPKKPKGRKKDWVMEAGAGAPPPEKPSPPSSPELVAGWYPTHPDMTGRLSYSPDSDELELARAVAEAQVENMQKTARKKATLAAAAAENRLFDCTQEKFLNEMDVAALADATAGSKAKTPQAAAASWNTPPTNTSVPIIPRAPAPRQFAPVFHQSPAHWRTPAKNDDSAFTMQSTTWPTVTGQEEESVAGRNGRHSAPPMLPSPTKWSPETQAAPAKKKAASVKPKGKPKAKKISAGGGDSHFTDGEVSTFFDILDTAFSSRANKHRFQLIVNISHFTHSAVMHGTRSVHNSRHHGSISREHKDVRDVVIMSPTIVIHGLLIQIFMFLEGKLQTIHNKSNITKLVVSQLYNLAEKLSLCGRGPFNASKWVLPKNSEHAPSTKTEPDVSMIGSKAKPSLKNEFTSSEAIPGQHKPNASFSINNARSPMGVLAQLFEPCAILFSCPRGMTVKPRSEQLNKFPKGWMVKTGCCDESLVVARGV
ncbi:unknown protein [Seminavis robusta]|uniref:Uncharacterized protein n=1 Tax=Seminavis robusta TaxID=568900 RepID=A0A9N8E3R4_9STRA|nr:unknown protein [Seminavis robusta]|eukprot:Sro493_g154210.1 n/a (489) ;mRNA; r:61159-62625